MSELRIEADVVYQHDKYGSVLVTGIAKMYSEWNPQNDMESNGTYVYFHTQFDGYGGLATPQTELVGDFVKAATKEQAFEYDNVSELMIDPEEYTKQMSVPDRPRGGLVEAPDWAMCKDCGGQLYILMWGEGIDSHMACTDCENKEIYR